MRKNTNSLISFVLATVVCLAWCTVAQAQLPEPVSLWRFEEGSGVTTADIGTGGHTGILVGDVAFVEDEERGSVLKFGTGEGYVETNAWITEFGIADWSVAAWIKTREQGMPIIGKSNGDRIWDFHEKQFYIGAGTEQGAPTAGAVHFYGNQAGENWGLSPVDDGMWHHVCVTWEDATDTNNVYVDGVLDNLSPVWDYYGGRGDNADDWVRIGFDCSGNSVSDFIGEMDDVAIFDVALTPEQVVELMYLSLPLTASNPNPGDGASDVLRDAVLSWKPGIYANKHDVYFGTVLDDVNDADRTNQLGVLVGQGQSPATYDPDGLLDFGQTYYWRIDEVNAPPSSTVFKGDVWSFTAETFACPIAGERITVTASSSDIGKGPENTINGFGLDANDLHSTVETDMWLSGGEPNAWIEYEFDKLHKLHQMWVWNHNTMLESAFGLGFKDVTVEYSVNGTDYTTLAGVTEFAQAPGAADYEHNTTVDFEGVTVKYVRLTNNNNWGDFFTQSGLSEVRFMAIPVFGRDPSPESGAADVDVDVTLGWRAGREAAKHDVYLSTDEQAVIDGTAFVSTETGTSYSSSPLDVDTTYYWRVDEVNDARTPTTWQGDIWNFTTQEYLVVDDFESYNEIIEGEESNLVYLTWIDGYDNPSVNGSTMGHTVPFEPSMEIVTFYDGRQSAPLYYNNTTASLSEVVADTSNLVIGRDWTIGAPQTLVLWVHGTTDNAHQQMYVKVGSAKVLYDGDITKPMWKQWNIDLAGLGINLSNVTQLSIGLERIGATSGSGMVIVDAIRLYKSAPAVASEELWIEAESGALGASWRTYDDPASSAGWHIGSEEDDGDDNNTAPGAEWLATYNFDVAGGTYKILFRGQAVDGDSFWVRIPTATSQTLEDPDQPDTGWVNFDAMGIPWSEGEWDWDDVHSNDHDNEAVIWTLSAGTHTLEIAKHEYGTLLDAIVITDLLD